MKWFRNLDRKLSRKLNLNRRFPGYFEPKIFRVAFALIIGFFLYVGFSNGWTAQANYVICNDLRPCLNPLYDPECRYDVCAVEVLQPGEWVGKRPNWAYENFEILTLVVLLLSFMLNHAVAKKRGTVPVWKD